MIPYGEPWKWLKEELNINCECGMRFPVHNTSATAEDVLLYEYASWVDEISAFADIK
jgi:hypothetical protein